MNVSSSIVRGAVAAVLAAASLGASAAVVNFSGSTDSGPLVGQSFSGQFSYADPAAGFDGVVDLDSFTFSFFGQTYGLLDADWAPAALFVNGVFTGIDYAFSGSLDTVLRPNVSLVAGFFDPSDAFFTYQVSELTGFGSVSFEAAGAVPVPGTLAIALAGLALLGAGRRRLVG